MTHELALILDFGSQYTQLIAKTVRHLGVYSEIVPCNLPFEQIAAKQPRALILSGSPWSVTKDDAPLPDERIWSLGLPTLGICYGMQLMARTFGGRVARADKKEYGPAQIVISDHTNLFQSLSDHEDVWMSHGDAVETLPDGFHTIATSANSPFAAIAHESKPMYALQFHPEVVHTPHGAQMLANFLNLAGFLRDWSPASFIEESIAHMRREIGAGKVILGLSGGVDSSVTAALLHRAVGDQLVPILVDTGLLRKNEAEEVRSAFEQAFGIKLIIINAGETFLSRLAGVTEPERKRKIIGHTFIEVFEVEARKHSDAQFLAQGTLYPDVIESTSFKGPSVTIKSHHNVGGLPEHMNLHLIEPLRELFKDEVRSVGLALGLPELLIQRHPFPGPGLAIRILGEITPERVRLLQDIDAVFISELHTQNLYHKTWQAFSVLLPVQSVGVMGDERTYESVCGLRAVSSVDGMTAECSDLPLDFLKHVANRIINEVTGVNRVVYDLSSKPPATIEWE